MNVIELIDQRLDSRIGVEFIASPVEWRGTNLGFVYQSRFRPTRTAVWSLYVIMIEPSLQTGQRFTPISTKEGNKVPAPRYLFAVSHARLQLDRVIYLQATSISLDLHMRNLCLGVGPAQKRRLHL